VVLISTVAAGPTGRDAIAGSRSRKADKIIKKHIRALGGLKNIEAIDNMQATGYVETEGFEVDFKLWMQRPNRSRIEISIQGFDIVQAYDGETARWINPLAGAGEPKEMPQAFARAMIRWTEFDGPLVNYRKKRHRVGYAGERELDDGRTAYDIELTRANGEEWHIFIDTESYLEVMRTFEQTFEGKTTEVVIHFSDFTEVEGLRTPRVIEGLAITGTPFRMVFVSFNAGVPVDKEFFSISGASDNTGDEEN
jgi:hypothetical protein